MKTILLISTSEQPGEINRICWNGKDVCRRGISYLLLLCVLASCTMPWGLPEPSSRKVTNEDIAGLWKFDEALLRLNLDGTFEISGSRRHNGYGTWIVSSQKNLVLTYAQRSHTSSLFYVYDTPDRGFGVFGGEVEDPDFWRPMERIRPQQD
jgi:hypothetical protein